MPFPPKPLTASTYFGVHQTPLAASSLPLAASSLAPPEVFLRDTTHLALEAHRKAAVQVQRRGAARRAERRRRHLRWMVLGSVLNKGRSPGGATGLFSSEGLKKRNTLVTFLVRLHGDSPLLFEIGFFWRPIGGEFRLRWRFDIYNDSCGVPGLRSGQG